MTRFCNGYVIGPMFMPQNGIQGHLDFGRCLCVTHFLWNLNLTIRDRLHMLHALSNNETSNDTKINDLVTMTVFFIEYTKNIFSDFLFHKRILFLM